MKIIGIIKKIKDIHKYDLILVKIGNFYHAYGRDSYIISYIFGYNLKIVDCNTSTCGFPIHVLNKICANLENKKINYMLLDRRNNYEVDLEFDFNKLNNYEKYYDKAKIYINYKRRIENINQYLLDNVQSNNFKNILAEMEQIINERREV